MDWSKRISGEDYYVDSRHFCGGFGNAEIVFPEEGFCNTEEIIIGISDVLCNYHEKNFLYSKRMFFSDSRDLGNDYGSFFRWNRGLFEKYN